MPPELTAAVACRLSPDALLAGERANPDELYLAPAGSLAFSDFDDRPIGPGGQEMMKVVANLPPGIRFPPRLVVCGVIISPIENASLVARHPDEIGIVSVGVTGTHTILAHPEDTATLFPFDRIRVDFEREGAPLRGGFDEGQSTFFVPRFVAVDSVLDRRAFAMVLQKGATELRVMLLPPDPDSAVLNEE